MSAEKPVRVVKKRVKIPREHRTTCNEKNSLFGHFSRSAVISVLCEKECFFAGFQSASSLKPRKKDVKFS